MLGSSDLKPYLLAKDEGQPYWFLQHLTRIKASGETTGGAFALLEQFLNPGFTTPYHVHRNEDESFYIFEGDITFVCDGKPIKAGPGSFVFGPRNVPHGFRVEGNSPARLLLLAVPSGFEQFTIEMGEPATDLTKPPSTPPDIQKLAATAAKYNIEILGLLPI